MDLAELGKNWNRLGELDPLWAILTIPEKIHNQWGIEEFFKTGVDEIEEMMRHIHSLGFPLNRQNALDFGCGVGRITQALGRHFSKCCGIDIAPSMIKLAREHNQCGNRCEYTLNTTDGLSMFEDDSWDFIYSTIVLQHMEPRYSKNYIREFLRVLSPGGMLVFQLPVQVRTAPPPSSSQDVLLTDAAFRAAVKSDRTEIEAHAGALMEVSATVKNMSPITWPSAESSPNHPVQLGNHWLNDKVEILVRDDGRASLEHDLAPNQEAELRLLVQAPELAGSYILELDMVQEGVAWFADQGSEAFRIRATIDAPGRESSPDTRLKTPMDHRVVSQTINEATMEMYGVPRNEVLETIAEGGGQVVSIIPDFQAGPEWTSFRYFITKGTAK